MKNQFEKIKAEALKKITTVKKLSELNQLEVFYLGRKGELTSLLRKIKDESTEKRKQLGQLANQIKQELQSVIEKKSVLFKVESATTDFSFFDRTLPGQPVQAGHLHPLTIIQRDLEKVFIRMGFMVLDGPELESEYYNFDSLNMPATHPARESQDTYFIKDLPGKVLRTQTSNVQVRAMRKYGAPLRIVAPGRVFRYENIDASHDNTFYQLEGLMVDKNISITNLIAVMKSLLKEVFNKEVKIRLRPGYFPFVEPGFELDVECWNCSGEGCSLCKQTGWVEMMPCGLVHPNVIEAGGLDAQEYSGFAFGLGLTRLAMMKFGINDIRLFLSGDLRLLKQL